LDHSSQQVYQGPGERVVQVTTESKEAEPAPAQEARRKAAWTGKTGTHALSSGVSMLRRAATVIAGRAGSPHEFMNE
jgi:hypothetical protein